MTAERLLLRRAKVLNGAEVDIVIADGNVVQIVPGGTAEDHGFKVVEANGAYVSSGWIDLHVHAFAELNPYGDEIDEIGIKCGVTTLVDAGSCGAERIGELAEAGKMSATQLLAFLNISKIGLMRIDELSQLEWIDHEKVLQAVVAYPEFIVGLKARISKSVVGDNGIQPLQHALELSEKTGLPLMVHIGSAPPDIREVLPLLQRNDVITHYLNGKSNNLFDKENRPLQVLRDAIERGVHLDVGHGTASFSFAVAEAAKQNGIDPDTISTDIYRGNRINGPVYSMANLLNKFLALGYSLEDTIARVTSRAAQWLGRPELGEIRINNKANLTLFRVTDKKIELVDSEGERRVAQQTIQAIGVIIGDKYMECEIRPEKSY
ncbi:amidohydrolase/deacetylase family metallohydrolase [Paenibacillus odorifer]|uniref:amidohydrolase/deacetylase family metallohydrolase n=1 Tax=Paenibacillus odorifer TaxID=189426 RepID=UPI00096DA39E|nr:amidohydrolase/deacetylase family metallohydrolase [Paenibacillus odorifer]OMD58953.1 dihydroorotase [Paenibacillus odorifer]